MVATKLAAATMWQLQGELTGSWEDSSFQTAVNLWLKRPNLCNKLVSCSSVIYLTNPQASESPTPADASHLVGCKQIETERDVQPARDIRFPPDTLRRARCMFRSATGRRETSVTLRKLVPKQCASRACAYELVMCAGPTAYMFLPLRPYSLDFETNMVSYMLISHRAGDSPVLVSRHAGDSPSLNTNGERDSLIESLGKLSCDKSLIDLSVSGCHGDQCPPHEAAISQVSLYTLNTPPEAALLSNPARDCYPTAEWLRSRLLPAVHKWAQESGRGGEFPASHSLIDRELYAITYDRLKQKYGREIAEMWPEVTDPQKFVHEDVAIASYLLVMWQQERQSDVMQSFCDVGCGNGLLVHILTSEGHPGKGIDIRARKIWSLYPPTTRLHELTLHPDRFDCDDSPLAHCDWLLGNHSDELTPWMAVLAARCRANFWVLPCCFFDLFGKYARKDSTRNQYREYVDFVGSVARSCGYRVEVDVMRIPSTKRVCLVGTPDPSVDRTVVLRYIDDMLTSSQLRQHASNFVPREKVERVRNCTKIERRIQDHVTLQVMRRLLDDHRSMEGHVTTTTDGRWRKGCRMVLSEVAGMFDAETKSHLKNECGGLKTLLKNHHQAFLVRGGTVELRDWSLEEESEGKRKRLHDEERRRMAWKSKPCWFDLHHPDGCPRPSLTCPFRHQSPCS